MLELNHKELVIPGLTKTYRVMHITDSHIVSMDERDEGVVIIDGGAHHGKLVTAFGSKRYPVFTMDGITSKERFAKLCDDICAEPDCADLIVFTGDILDFFTDSAMEFLTAQLNRLPIPYLFVMGNHDSIFYPLGEEATRQRFAHLCSGNTEVQKVKLGELAVIGIDNARDRYTDEGLEQLKKALEGERYAILCQHIPLCTDAYYEHAMAAANCCYALGGQGVCADDSWKTVFAMIEAEDSPVRALMCGDCHREHVSYIGKAAMHTTALTARNAPALFTISG
jgi:predicted MPP superfamily phosphohydrolase